MSTRTLEPADGSRLLHEPKDFSLVLGGPVFQLLRRSHLADDALGLLSRRIIVFSLITWLPLLVLSALEGKVLGGGPAIPFLLDLEVHVRFLVVVPLLIGAELVVHRRMRSVAKQFLERHLIPESGMTRFDAATASVFRLRNSVLAEALLLVLVYGFGILVWRHYVALETATWYAAPSVEGPKFSLAGMWYSYVSLPILQFLLFRWYFRSFIWSRFLWQVSRIDLNLAPTHPDRFGGLGFLSATAYAFVPLLMAHGALLAGLLANRIYHLGAQLPDFVLEICVFVLLLICVVLGPLLVFAPQLAQAKRTGKYEYGLLAERYVRAFDAKWLRGGAPPNTPLLGSADIQSPADLDSSLQIVRTIHVLPFTKETVLQIGTATLAPVAPLLLSMMSLEDVLKKLVGIFF